MRVPASASAAERSKPASDAIKSGVRDTHLELSPSPTSLKLALHLSQTLDPLSISHDLELSISNLSQARSPSPTHLKLALHLSTLSPSSFVSSLTPSPELSLSISNPGSLHLDPLSIKLRASPSRTLLVAASVIWCLRRSTSSLLTTIASLSQASP
ncbi:Uncharacterized protein Rs2_29960 [Raphanus sativus]|nr:Uncharacterized protein Rs2_29960 [Raphanus sativus]